MTRFLYVLNVHVRRIAPKLYLHSGKPICQELIITQIGLNQALRKDEFKK